MAAKITAELVSAHTWDQRVDKQHCFHFSPPVYDQYLSPFISPDPHKTCIEIGAYPGGYLGWIAKKYRYRATALDYSRHLNFIKKNFTFNGINHVQLINTDFIAWSPSEKYDLVLSHGFIEHFSHPAPVIKKHLSLLKPGGILVLSVPYLRYYQLWVRQLLYSPQKWQQVVSTHNLDVMDLEVLLDLLKKDKHLSLLFAGFINRMTLWIPADDSGIRSGRRWLYDLFIRLSRQVNKLNLSSRYFSPEILIIVRNTRRLSP